MAKRKQRLTPNQQVYRKEINRIKRFVRNAEKRGYIFPEDIVPSMPKRVTAKSLSKIKNIKPANLYQKARAVNQETGEIIPVQEAIKQQRSKSARKGAQTRKQRKQASIIPNITDIVIQNFRSYILGFPNQISEAILAWLDTLIRQQGKQDVAQMLESASETLGDYLTRMGYDSGTAIAEYTSAMMNYLPNASEAYKRDVQEMFDAWELGYVETDYENS